MKIVKTWCENTLEGTSYLKLNGYGEIVLRFTKDLFLCIGDTYIKECRDVVVLFTL